MEGGICLYYNKMVAEYPPEIESYSDKIITDSVTFLIAPAPLDMKGESGHPQKTTLTTTSIAMSNTRIQDIDLLSSGRPKSV
jgi:hypothetical protein